MGFLSNIGNVVKLATGTTKSGVGEKVEDFTRPISDAGNAVADFGSSAWDVLSGERDWRRAQKAAQDARDWTANREDTAVQRRQSDLLAAGINPMLAGAIGGADSSAAPVPQSHSAQSVQGAVSLAGGLLRGGVESVKGLADVGLIRANSARSLAETSVMLRKVDPEIARIVAATAVDQAQVPKLRADTALSTAHRHQANIRSQQMKYELPRFHAESEYYKRYGRNAVLARENRNPWQSSMLVGGQVGSGLEDLGPKVNSAASLMVDKANRTLKKADRSVRPRRSSPPNYFMPGGR